MYIVGKDKKTLQPIKEVNFTDIDMDERYCIQQCIISSPDVLGEQLLIIQEEFSEFENTDERLDLLALDKNGNIVVIENKRDDSGKDVTWQAIKYASYCSTLTREEINKIYGKFLIKKNIEGTPEDLIAKFLTGSDFSSDQSEFVDYPSDEQRIIMVSHNFRKEVLSAVQWLLNKNIDISCVQLKPYLKNDGEVLLDSDVILPQPEMKEYTLKLSEKNEEKKKIKKSQERYKDFWTRLDSSFEQKSESQFKNTTIAQRTGSWVDCASGIKSGVRFSLVANSDEFRVELYIDTPDQNENKNIFRHYETQKESIESELQGYNMIWEDLPNKRASRIAIKTKEFNFAAEEDWSKIIDFLISGLQKFEPCMLKHKPHK